MAALIQLFATVVCVALCLASSSPSNEEMAREIIEHILRGPNSDKVLNSVLERNRQQPLNRQLDNEECDDPLEILSEFTEMVQDSRERELRQLGVHVQKYRPICPIRRIIKKLNNDEYEYRPAYYEEVRCSTTPNTDVGVTNKICSSMGLACIQWNKTIHITRRRYSSDCWETRSMVIPAGCECMWPVHRLGNMELHV